MAREKYRFNTRGGRVFDVVNVIVLSAVGIIALIPFIYVIAGSFATEAELATRSFFLWPETFSLRAYESILTSPAFIRALVTTIAVTAVGTAVQLLLTASMAYPLSKANLPGRRFFLYAVIVTLVFGGGMIPTFLVVKDLGLLDTYWALILPLAINPFSLIIIKNFFQQLPGELEESAKIDGANEIQTLWRIILPLSLPGLAVGLPLVFSLTAAAYVTPQILGGNFSPLLGTLIEQQILTLNDWPFGAAISTLLIAMVLAGNLLFLKIVNRRFARWTGGVR